MAEKSPVSSLYELCAICLIRPKFNLVHESTNTKDQLFVYETTLKYKENDIRVVGSSKIKKVAKENAARSAIKKLTELLSEIDPPSKNIELENFEKCFGHDIIIKLKDHCKVQKLPIPEFMITDYLGPHQAKQFTIKCSVGSFEQSGTAGSKKRARRLSAYKMFEKLTSAANTDNEILIPEQKSLQENLDTAGKSDHEKSNNDVVIMKGAGLEIECSK
ncbi:interferon-inducible double-stranded RNA-dependent protein kinase activator A homolog [Ctenocephalides felis]|uniref:interferon-inducible double-stranded RNA-dependent protein kinase activator A homolog n=1 Tax=Ctenocephalides felis TaxID=7515 RepID=UPI000E6E4A3D|nr:interferon-inducible double-stranded RNA-dependent protein kinase activator A homolog [Ctenocephalides felis]